MHARTTLAIGVVGGFLAFAGPALAASGAPGHPPTPATHPTVTRATTAATTSSTLYVNGNIGTDGGACSKAAPCETIQYAIDQAPTTAKIMVSSGNYPEQLTILGKNLSIVGAGKSLTTIDPTVLSGSDYSPGVLFESAAKSSLSGVTVDTTGVTDGPSCPAGVAFVDEGGTLTSDAIAVTTPANASYSCEYGVAAYNSKSTAAHSFTMSSTTVTDYGETGVYCGANAGSCTLTSDHITGYGPTDGAQYGVDLQQTTATLNANTITGNVDTGASAGTYVDTEGFGIYANNIQTFKASQNVATGNDDDFFATGSTGPWTITGNTFSHATNESTTPIVATGSGIGDGLTLDDVSDATVTANTLSSNADRGLNLLDVQSSTFGKNAAGKPNTISNNADDGIALTEYLNPNAYVSGENSEDAFNGNVIDANGGDGIFVAATAANGTAEASDNAFSANMLQGNLRFDALDQSTGPGSDGTANSWTGNTCKTSSPAGICSASAS